MRQNIYELALMSVRDDILAKHLATLVNDPIIVERIINGLPKLDEDKIVKYLQHEVGDTIRYEGYEYNDNRLIPDCLNLKYSYISERWLDSDPGVGDRILEWDEYCKLYERFTTRISEDETHHYKVRIFSSNSIAVIPEDFIEDEPCTD